MPEPRGRKRRPRDRRRDRAAGDRQASPDATLARETPVAPSRARTAAEPALPSAYARTTGVLIAGATAFVGGIVTYNGIAASGGAEAPLRIIGGLLLIALGVVVAALCIAPAQIRDWFARRRGRRRTDA